MIEWRGEGRPSRKSSLQLIEVECIMVMDSIPEELHNYKDVISALDELVSCKRYVFRGYNKQNELLPNLIRDEKKDYSHEEIKLLENFEKYGSNYYSANNAIDFLSYAQHFGLPTRLLDFSFNPFIALSFALYDPKTNGKYKHPEDREYYYIRYCCLDENVVTKSLSYDVTWNMFENSGTENAYSELCHRYFNKLTDIINEKSDDEQLLEIRKGKILFLDPNLSNPRIIMQQGLFMLPYTIDTYEHTDIINNNTKIIKIDKKLRSPLLNYLDVLGYNAFRLMPDLTNVCKAITRNIIDERQEKSTLFKRKKNLANNSL